MLKQVVYLIIASILVILLATYLQQLLQLIMEMYTTLTVWFSNIFSSTRIGLLLTQLLALFLIPLVIVAIVTGIYWIFKRKAFPVFNEVMWVLWIVLATMLVVSH